MSQHFSLDWIHLRCSRDEDSGCLLWRQGTNPAGAPVATKLLPTGKKPTVQLRRAVWELKNGPIPDGFVVTCSCKRVRCLSHLELITKAEVVRRQWQKTEARAKLTASTTRASRARAKINMDTARSIRNSDDTLEVAAERHGVSITLASLIRRGERWKESHNPFAGLAR